VASHTSTHTRFTDTKVMSEERNAGETRGAGARGGGGGASSGRSAVSASSSPRVRAA
jgi:hypothetical protein